MCRTGGPRCNGSSKTAAPTEREQAIAEMFGTDTAEDRRINADHESETGDAAATGYETFPDLATYHEAKYGVTPDETLFVVPGTGSDWANAKCPEGLVPVPPATTVMRPWDKIKGRQVPTDREQLAWYDERSKGPTTGSTVHAQLAAEQIRKRAAAGHHDGSLPELGDYKPTHFTHKEDQK